MYTSEKQLPWSNVAWAYIEKHTFLALLLYRYDNYI